jgi:hypothetical protein
MLRLGDSIETALGRVSPFAPAPHRVCSAFAETLKKLEIHWSWMQLIPIRQFAHLKTLRCIMHADQIIGCNIQSIRHCLELERLCLELPEHSPFTGQPNEESDEGEAELRRLNQALSQLPALTALQLVFHDSDSSVDVWISKFLVTTYPHLTEFSLQFASDSYHDLRMTALAQMMGGHCPREALRALMIDSHSVPTGRLHPAAQIWQHAPNSHWSLERIALKYATLDINLLELLISSCASTLREMKLEQFWMENDYTLQQLCEVLSKAPKLERVDLEMAETPDKWGKKSFESLRNLPSLQMVIFRCPPYVGRATYRFQRSIIPDV